MSGVVKSIRIDQEHLDLLKEYNACLEGVFGEAKVNFNTMVNEGFLLALERRVQILKTIIEDGYICERTESGNIRKILISREYLEKVEELYNECVVSLGDFMSK